MGDPNSPHEADPFTGSFVNPADLSLRAERKTATALVNELREELIDNDDQPLLRVAAHWYGSLLNEDLTVVRYCLATDPGSCGNQRWDALIGGLAERIARLRGIPVPAWTADPARTLTTWWFLAPFPSLHASALANTPPELSNRGVFIHRSSLESV